MATQHAERGSRLRRTADRLIGCTGLVVLGALRKPRGVPVQPGCIGLMMLGAIGDTLLASAIVQDLRAAYPTARMLAFVSNSNRHALELLEGFDQVIVLPLMRPMSAVQEMRRHPCDILIDTSQWPRIGALLTYLARTRFTIGFNTAGQRRHVAFDAYVEHSAVRHEIENFRALLIPLSIRAISMPRFRTSLFDKPLLRTMEAAYVVFHPWASGYRSELREWDESNWVRLGQQVLSWGYRLVITGGPEDAARSCALAAMLSGAPHVQVLAGSASLSETAREVAGAMAVVSVNTGIMHLAALLNVPMVALHGPTNPRRWGPLSRSAVVVGPGPECGCAFLNLGFEYPRMPPPCMQRIQFTDVAEPLRAILFRPSVVVPIRDVPDQISGAA